MMMSLLTIVLLSCSPNSKSFETEEMGLNLEIYSGESSVGNHQNPQDLAAGGWKIMKGAPEQTIVDVRLWVPKSIPLVKDGDVELDYWGDLRISNQEDILVENGGESITLKKERGPFPGRVFGYFEGERTGEFRLRFSRKGEEVASDTTVLLTDPVLSSHSDGGEVFESESSLSFDLTHLNEGEHFDVTWWLVIVCAQGQVFSEYQYWYDTGFTATDEEYGTILNWNLEEIYSSLNLTATSDCEMTLTQSSGGISDPAIGYHGLNEAHNTSKFTATFIKE